MLKLRPFEPEDAKAVSRWLLDEKSFYQWSAGLFGGFPMVPETLNKFYDKNRRDGFYPTVVIDGDGVVGQLLIRFTDNLNKTVRFGFIVLSPERRGKGYGREMLLLAKGYAFEVLGANKITLGVFENNPAAIKCYESVGFVSDDGRYEYYDILGERWKCNEMICLK